MNTYNYKENTIFSDEKNQKVDIRKIGDIIDKRFKYIEKKDLFDVIKGNSYENKELSLTFKINIFLRQHIKLKLKMEDGKYFNIYFPIGHKNIINILYLINDIILYINLRYHTMINNFSFSKEFGFNLYIKTENFKLKENKKTICWINMIQSIDMFIENIIENIIKGEKIDKISYQYIYRCLDEVNLKISNIQKTLEKL